MSRRVSILFLLVLAVCIVGVATVNVGTAAPPTPIPSPTPTRPPPRLEPVAETKLLMEGLTLSNFRGVEKLLVEKPTDVEAWKFMRGQALLIAETGNLLLVRPPKNAGETVWMERTTDMRDAATSLAKFAADRDYDKTRQALIGLAATCNHCHQTFRVAARITAFESPPDKVVLLDVRAPRT